MTGAPAVQALLAEGRVREKAQALFYRRLAAEAEAAADGTTSERLNELHADEQHHLSRLTARLLELGGRPEDLRSAPTPPARLDAWEADARERERDENSWYERALAQPLDEVTSQVMLEILESERRHHAELRGKWMSA